MSRKRNDITNRELFYTNGADKNTIKIVESGIRPGEKLYEELLSKSENTRKQVYEKIFIGKVTNAPLNEVLKFVQTIEQLEDGELKEQLIDFANGRIELTTEETQDESSLAYA